MSEDNEYEKELQSYEAYHQAWLRQLVNEKIQQVHEKNRSNHAVFNLSIDNVIIQTVCNGTEILSCNYLYINLQDIKGEIFHEEYFDQPVTDVTILETAHYRIKDY